MKNMKKVALTLVAGLGLSSLVPSVQAQDKVQVTFWHAMNGPHQEMITELVEEFNASQDEIEVIEQNQGDYSTLSQSIMASGASGTLPTMAQLTASNTPDYRENGLLVPLDDYLQNEEVFGQALYDDIYEGFLSGVTYDDGVYAIPFSKSVRLMYVNQDLLNEVDAEIPTTWQEIEDLGQALQDAGIDTPALGLENSLTLEIETMVRQNGATWIADDLSEVEIASEAAAEPIHFLKNLVDNGHARLAGEDGYMSGPFSQGESALYIGSSAGLPYVLPGIEENNIDFTTAEIPVYGEGDPLTLFAGNDLGVFSSASEEEQAAAVRFMAFLLQPDHTARWAAGTGYLPVTQSGTQSQVWLDYLAENPYQEAATAELAYGKSTPAYAGSGEVFSTQETAFEAIMIDGADIEAELQALEDLVREQLGL